MTTKAPLTTLQNFLDIEEPTLEQAIEVFTPQPDQTCTPLAPGPSHARLPQHTGVVRKRRSRQVVRELETVVLEPVSQTSNHLETRGIAQGGQHPGQGDFISFWVVILARGHTTSFNRATILA